MKTTTIQIIIEDDEGAYGGYGKYEFALARKSKYDSDWLADFGPNIPSIECDVDIREDYNVHGSEAKVLYKGLK